MTLRLWLPVTCSPRRMIFTLILQNQSIPSTLQAFLLFWTVEAPLWCARALQ